METTDRENIISAFEDYEPYAHDLPAVTMKSRVYLDALALLKEHGYWINPTSQDCHCSECGEQPEHEPGGSVPLYDFCPYCGAKMEVKWNE